MSTEPQRSIPSFLSQARAFYAEAFAHQRKSTLASSMSEWDELDESEQSFALAHLAYLNLEAQANNQLLLTQIRDLLDELAEGLVVAVEAFAESLDGEQESPEDDEVPFEPPSLPAPDIIDAEPTDSAA